MELDQAQDAYERSLKAWQRLYPENRCPNGSPELAQVLRALGMVLQQRRIEPARAGGCVERAMVMCRKCSPETRWPAGHNDLAGALSGG